jgi:hypothetical protein
LKTETRNSKFAWRLAVVAVWLVYFSLRLPGLARAPLFNDEAFDGLWVAQLLGSPGLETAFAPWRAAGKVGLFVWFVAFLDGLAWPARWGPLLLWRGLAVIAGAISTVLVMIVARRLARPLADRPRTIRLEWSAAILAGLGYACWPAAHIHERMALFEAPLVATYLLAILAAARLRAGPPIARRLACLLGLAFALPVAVKLNGAPALALGWATAAWQWRRGAIDRTTFGWIIFASLPPALLAVGPAIAQGSLGGMAREHLQAGAGGGLDPRSMVLIARDFAAAYFHSINLPILILLLWGADAAVRSAGRTAVYWLAWTAAPVALIIATGHPASVFSRHYLPFLAPAWALLGIGLADLLGRGRGRVRQAILYVATALSIGLLAYRSIGWTMHPEQMPLTPGDRNQYVAGWPSGRMLPALQAQMEALARGDRPVEVLTLHDFQNPSVGLAYLYRLRTDQFRVRGVGSIEEVRRLLGESDAAVTRVWLDLGDSARAPEFVAAAQLTPLWSWPANGALSPPIVLWRPLQ